MRHLAFPCFTLIGVFLALPSAVAQTAEPSRLAEKNCAWEKKVNAGVGLAAWVQRCDFGHRKISFHFKGSALLIKYSDGGKPTPLVEVFDLLPHETPVHGVQRVFAQQTDKLVARRCVLAPFSLTNAPPGVLRFTFVPDASYQQQLAVQANANDIPEPPCGQWGTMPDGLQYFEVQAASKANKVLFVRVGQDQALFDENSLQLLERTSQAKTP